MFSSTIFVHWTNNLLRIADFAIMLSRPRIGEKRRGGDKRVFLFRPTADSSKLHVGPKGMSTTTKGLPPPIPVACDTRRRRDKRATDATEEG